jgi:hypothetical protein
MATKNYLEWKIEDIIAYCQEHNQVEWLKATAAKKVECKVYPRIKVAKLQKDGSTKWVSVADKSQQPKVEVRPISFVEIKTEFLNKFGLAPAKKQKAPTMYDKIANL